jgi:transposase
VNRSDVDTGSRPGVMSTDQVRMKELERQVRDIKRTIEILKAVSVFLLGSSTRNADTNDVH